MKITNIHKTPPAPDQGFEPGKFSYSSDELLSILLEHSDEIIIILDKNLRVQLYNKAAENYINNLLRPAIYKGMDIYDLAPKHMHIGLQSIYAEVMKGNTRKFADKITGVSNEDVYISSTFKPIMNDTGDVVGVITITRDFTDRKKDIQSLKDSEQRLRLAIEGSNHGLWDWNISTGETYYSESYKKLYGYFDEEMTNNISEWEKRIHPDDRPMIDKALETHLNGKEAYHEVNYRLKDKAGKYRWIMARAIITDRDENGKPLRMIGTHTDITEQKQKDESYKLLFYHHPLPMWIYDIETLRIVEVNDAAVKQYGYTRDEFLQLTVKDLKPTEDLASFQEVIDEVQTGSTASKKSGRHRKKNGEVIDVEVIGEFMKYEGRNCRMLSVSDITERVRTQKELQRSNERFKTVSKATSDAIYDYHLEAEHIFWGENLYVLFGYTSEEFNYHNWDSLVREDYRKKVKNSLEQAFLNKKQNYWKEEYPLRLKSGEYKYVLDRGFIIRDEQGNALQLIGAIQDISEQKLHEQQLLSSNARFDAVMKATHDLIWDWNLETGDFYRDPEGAKKVYGVHDVTSIKEFSMWMERVHPKDHERVERVITEFLQSSDKDNFEVEYRFRKDDGSYSYVYDRGILIRNGEGKPVKMVGAAQNITERKRLEQQLLQRELDKQRLISRATIETQEIERGEIGKELHDNVNQVLTTTKLYLDLALDTPELKDELIGKSSKNIIYVINEIRQLSRSLMNPSLGDLGLVESINDLIEDVNITRKIAVELKMDDDVEEVIAEENKLIIYRIIQEALNNAIKHASAEQVLVSLVRDNVHCILSIKDNGVGFDSNQVKKGAGLKSIQNRVYLANGSLDITTAPCAGCSIEIRLPINNR